MITTPDWNLLLVLVSNAEICFQIFALFPKPPEKATENLNSKYESAQLETQSKIAKLEATIEKLTMEKKPLPKMVKSKVTKKPCLSCGKLFDEVKGMILK